MAIEFCPLPLPASADPTKFHDFGREVKGIQPGNLSSEEFKKIEEALYTHGALLFRDADLTPEQQYAFTKAFDSESEMYGHGNNQTEKTPRSLLNSILKTIPRVPQVQLIGNGNVYNHEGLAEVALKHPSHTTFHKTRVSAEDEAKGYTRFYRWHMDAALYALNPPKVTTLYGISVPQGPKQICRYDDGTGDELEVSLGATAFVSGKTMFDLLPEDLKSLAVRSKVKYMPHPFIWMATARSNSIGLGLETEGKEVPLKELPSWDESKIQILPMTWKNPVTGALHFEVNPSGAGELLVEPLPGEAKREGALFPDGAHLTDLKEVRALLFKMQRPAISPSLVYPHDWREKDMMLFHNRGVLHSALGAFRPDQVRIFHQCNVAGSDEPAGPTPEDVAKYA